jgi:hypothetical protein
VTLLCRVAALAVQAVLCFSAWTNLRKICNTKTEDSLSCIHGLRVFSLLWVIAGHTCMFSFPVSGEFRRFFNCGACSDIISLYTKIITLFGLTFGGSQ